MTTFTQEQLIQRYSDHLRARFHSNSTATQVLIALIIIMMLVVEVVKFLKKTYQWQTEYEVNLDNKYVDDSKISIREAPNEPLDNQNELKPAQDRNAERELQPSPSAERTKKEVVTPPLIQIQDIIKRTLPQLAVVAINVVMLSAYQFVTISAYVVIVLIVISEVLGMKETEHINLKFILEVITKLLMIGWYINVLAVAKPKPY